MPLSSLVIAGITTDFSFTGSLPIFQAWFIRYTGYSRRDERLERFAVIIARVEGVDLLGGVCAVPTVTDFFNTGKG
jgi:hypothetical protein